MMNYVRGRINERSFWIGVGTAVTAASVLPGPWNWIALGVGVMASLVPDGKIRGERAAEDGSDAAGA